MMKTAFTISLPGWVEGFAAGLPARFTSPEARMRVAVDLSRENIRRGTGGPFGAVVVDMDSGQLVAVGVNGVVPQNCSLAHAETVALALAQQALGTFDLSTAGRFELVTSCAPCAMCLGAIAWAGLASVLCGAAEADARAAGFDEGDKPARWQQALRRRGIAVAEDILRPDAAAVLADYRRAGGPLYNPAGRP